MKRVNDKLTDDDILAECRYQSSQASGSEFASDELTESRKNALRYYLARSRGDEIEGRSDVISKDVADMIDAMLTQMMPVFATDDLVQFGAVSEQDEPQARTESQFCNNIIMERNSGFILFETLLKDALLSKNATAKVLVDINEKVESERYKGLTEMEASMILQPNKPNQEINVTKFDEGENGIDVNMKRTTTKRKLIVEAVAPENFSVTSEWKSQYLEECTYCVERLWKTKSELIEMGYKPKDVIDLPTSTADTKIDSIERNQINDEQNFFNTSPSMQIVELEEHYIRIDQDGDGIAELHKVVTVENILLSNEEVECVPYANGVAFLMGHRFYGQSVYDKIKEVQDSKTFFLRQWQDNALAGNHKKIAVDSANVNMDDLTNGRPNAIVRTNGAPGNSIMEMPITDIGASCEAAMNYWDKIRTERSGSSLDLQSNQMKMPSNVGDQGVNTLIANLEKVSALATRNFTETLVHSIYKLTHKFMRLYFPEEMTAKMGGAWQSTNPSQWLEREGINVMVPPTPTEKVLQQIELEKAIMQATNEMDRGKDGITTDESNIYQMKLDHMRLAGIDNPQKYLIDPQSPPALQRAAQNEQMAQQNQQMQQQMMMQQQAAQFELQNEMLRTQILEVQRNWENDKEELQFKYTELEQQVRMDKYTVDVKAETEESKIVGDSITKIELKGMDNDSKEPERDTGTEGERGEG